MKLYQLAFPAALTLLPAYGPLPSGMDAGITLPETGYQDTVRRAQTEYSLAARACSYVDWSSRDECERNATNALGRSMAEAKAAYVREQASFRAAPEAAPSSSAGR
jgi:hypothetical protein